MEWILLIESILLGVALMVSVVEFMSLCEQALTEIQGKKSEHMVHPWLVGLVWAAYYFASKF